MAMPCIDFLHQGATIQVGDTNLASVWRTESKKPTMGMGSQVT